MACRGAGKGWAAHFSADSTDGKRVDAAQCRPAQGSGAAPFAPRHRYIVPLVGTSGDGPYPNASGGPPWWETPRELIAVSRQRSVLQDPIGLRHRWASSTAAAQTAGLCLHVQGLLAFHQTLFLDGVGTDRAFGRSATDGWMT